MNTKHILLTSALVVSALAFTSCEDFFDTSSKKDLNTETAYSNLESAEMALVGCYDGWADANEILYLDVLFQMKE